MLCRATQDGRVIVKCTDKTWPTGGGNGKTRQYSCRENPMSSMKEQKHITLEDESPRLEGVQYAMGEEQRAITNISRKNELAEPNRKQHSTVAVSCGESQVQCCKQYCIEIWNVRSMNQGNWTWSSRRWQE